MHVTHFLDGREVPEGRPLAGMRRHERGGPCIGDSRADASGRRRIAWAAPGLFPSPVPHCERPAEVTQLPRSLRRALPPMKDDCDEGGRTREDIRWSWPRSDPQSGLRVHYLVAGISVINEGRVPGDASLVGITGTMSG